MGQKLPFSLMSLQFFQSKPWCKLAFSGLVVEHNCC